MLLNELKSIVGDNAWVTDEHELEPHLHEPRGRVSGKTLVLLSPRNTSEVAAIVRACARAGCGIVPQGGNTGLCGGAIPDDSGEQVILSLSRMNQIRSVSADDFSMTVEAGCVLQHAQEAAARVDRLVPLSLGAEGSCQIGGNISTNAGGINVIRYGTMRQQVLGLEVVLANGETWDGLRSLRKDTGGYDMKQVFIGSEGTLGIITAATLRLFPAISNTTSALIAVATPQAAVQLLGRLRAAQSDRLIAFELISDRAFRYGAAHVQQNETPLDATFPWYVLMQSATGPDPDDLEVVLGAEFSNGRILNALVAKSGAEADQLWRVRHAISEGQKAHGVSLKHDISVPIGSIDVFMSNAESAILRQIPDARIVAFGHVGDGNLHYNITQPVGADPGAFREQGTAASEAVYDIVARLGGSFSAEHGVGVVKKPLLKAFRSEIELDLMRTLKSALDPENTLNPGKVI